MDCQMNNPINPQATVSCCGPDLLISTAVERERESVYYTVMNMTTVDGKTSWHVILHWYRLERFVFCPLKGRHTRWEERKIGKTLHRRLDVYLIYLMFTWFFFYFFYFFFFFFFFLTVRVSTSISQTNKTNKTARKRRKERKKKKQKRNGRKI